MFAARSFAGLLRPAYAVFAGLVILAAACGGGGSDGETPGADGSPAAEVPTPIPSKLDSLESYRYTVKVDGTGGPLVNSTTGQPVGAIEISGIYIKPDKSQLTVKTAAGEVGQTIIGGEIWRTVANRTSGPVQIAPQSQAELTFIAAIWDRTDFGNGLNCSGREEVNGVNARKCSIDKATYQKTAEPFGGLISAAAIRDPSSFTWDIWMPENGDYPIRIRATLIGKDASAADYNIKLELDMTNINDKSIQINKPAQ